MGSARNLTRAAWLATAALLALLPFIPPTNPQAKGLQWWPQVQSWAIGIVVVTVLGLLAGLSAAVAIVQRWWAA